MASTILITGGTGTTGRYILRELRQLGVQPRALVRSEAKAEQVRDEGAEPVLGDFAKPDTLGPAMEGIDRVLILSAPDARMVELQSAVVDAAGAAGVRRVVKISALGAAGDAPYQLGRWHGDVERHIEGSGMEWTHLRPHSFMQNLLASAASIREGTLYSAMGEGRIPMVDARDVAAVAARLLVQGGLEREAPTLTGPRSVSRAEVAETLGRTIGRKVRYVPVSPEAERQAVLEVGLPQWLADDLVSLSILYASGDVAGPTGVVTRVLGRPARSLDDFARDYRDVFAGE